MTTQEVMKWRYATKKFNGEKIAQEDLDYILQAGNLSATSYGLQPISFVVVSDDEIKEKLLPHAYNQMQVTSCSDLIVICASTQIDEVYIKEYISRLESERGMEEGTLAEFQKVIISDVTNRSEEERTTWAHKQGYITLGSMMIAAAEKKIDGCPMEGFDNARFDEILRLSEHNLTSTVIFPVGIRSEEDETQHYRKVRKDLEKIVIRK